MINGSALRISLFGLLLAVFCQPLLAAKDHSHNASHSDALLFLLGEKIAIKKLQSELASTQSEQERSNNLNIQKRRLGKAMPILDEYLSRPESRYPNMQMYHESLKSRGAILKDYSSLINGFYMGVSGKQSTSEHSH